MLKHIDDSFGGQVYSYPVNKLECILDENLLFVESGKLALLKALKVPNKFFEKQEVVVKRDLLIRQKVEFNKDAELLLLKRNDEVVFASILNNAGTEDPSTKFNINTDNHFVALREDLTKGYTRYVYMPETLVRSEFCATLFMDVPILYHSKWIFESGLFRVICSNGMVDNVLSTTFALKVHDLDAELMAGITNGVIQGIKDSSDNYKGFLSYLNETPIGTEIATNLLYEWKKKSILPKTLVQECLAWLDYIVLSPDKQTDPSFPNGLTCYMDLLNLITRYAQNIESVSKIKKVETLMFKVFYEIYKKDTKESLQGIHLKELVENLGLL